MFIKVKDIGVNIANVNFITKDGNDTVIHFSDRSVKIDGVGFEAVFAQLQTQSKILMIKAHNPPKIPYSESE